MISVLDPVFRGPFWGSILMAIASSIIGAIAFVRKETLLGESLSHSAYPGVILGVIFSVSLGFKQDLAVMSLVLVFGFVFAYLGYLCIRVLQSKFNVSSDVAQSYILTAFLGLGITLASLIQKSHSVWYQKIRNYLFGQAVTMSDIHILFYGGFALIVTFFVVVYFTQLKAMLFDPVFCKNIGAESKIMKHGITAFFALVVVLGMRSVGTILMCGMIVAPAVCAKQITNRFSKMIVVSAVIGAISAAVGVYLSVIVPEVSSLQRLPTGPAIVIVASSFCLLAFLFSAKTGLFLKLYRKFSFQSRCVQEHLLKFLWKQAPNHTTIKDLHNRKISGKLALNLALGKLKRGGWVEKCDNGYSLSEDGRRKAAYIVRVHRLWELYLSKCLGFSEHQLHNCAEEIEHVITPEVEDELTKLLENPQVDPHNQPIPNKEFML